MATAKKTNPLPRRNFKGMRFNDGLQSLTNTLINRRNVQNTSAFTSQQMSYSEMRALYKDGLGRKIVDIKADYALRNSIVFKRDEDEVLYKKYYEKYVRDALTYSIAFGRGVILIVEIGVDPALPLSENFVNEREWKLEAFSGDLVTTYGYTYDIMSPFFLKPEYYVIGLGGNRFHHSRVIDFTYIDPPKFDLPLYQFGGISEFQFLRDQMIGDAVVQRASASILEKNASFFYKILGFKDALENDNVGGGGFDEPGVVNYVSTSENSRSIYGAGIIDMEDDVISVTQSLTDLPEINRISIQRLAMYAKIPVAFLVGEDVQGLNASGKIENTQFGYMIANIRDKYAEPGINKLFAKIGLHEVTFKESADLTPVEQADYESKVIANAKSLYEMSEDGDKYLEEKGIIKKETLLSGFKAPKTEEDDDLKEEPDVVEPEKEPSEGDDGNEQRADAKVS
jgi:hypothetical protein